MSFIYAGIAQLVEHRTCNAAVVGSSPSTGSKWKPHSKLIQDQTFNLNNLKQQASELGLVAQ